MIPVTDEDVGTRLDKFLSGRLTDLSRSRLKALIEGGFVAGYTLSDPTTPHSITSASRSLKGLTHVTLTIPEPEAATPKAEAILLDVVYEDTDLIIVNKPAGMVVHPAPGSARGTLVNALLHHCGSSLSGVGGVRRPGIVHRIDKDTSGLLVVAKHDKAHAGLAEQFAAHTIERRYTALVHGHPNPLIGRVEGAIGRHPRDRKKMALVTTGGKHAVTHYRTQTLYRAVGQPLAAAIECRLETGRTHQVRVHMAHLRHALIGDPVYGGGRRLPSDTPADVRSAVQGFDRQALHAKSLGFTHPTTGQALQFSSELPNEMIDLINALEPYRV